MREPHKCRGIIALGHILLDIIGMVEVLPETLGQFNSDGIHVDSASIHRVLDTLDTGPERVIGACSRSLGGGAAVTSMVAANLGLEATFMGAIGKDTEGELLKNLLTQAGARFIATYSGRETGIFLSLKDKVGNQILRVSPSAARDIRSASIEESELRHGYVLYLDGLLIDSEDWLRDIACRARRNNMTIALDFSTPGNAVTNAGRLRAFADSFCDIVFANEQECEVVYGREVGEKLRDTLVLVEKRGKDGVTLYSGGKKIRHEAAGVSVKDTTCAGDALAAGFIKGMSEGLDYAGCLSLGSKAASIAIQYTGSGYDSDLMKKSIVEDIALIKSKLFE